MVFSGGMRLTALGEVGTPLVFVRLVGCAGGRGLRVWGLKREGYLCSGTSVHTGLGLQRELCTSATPGWTLGAWTGSGCSPLASWQNSGKERLHAKYPCHKQGHLHKGGVHSLLDGVWLVYRNLPRSQVQSCH